MISGKKIGFSILAISFFGLSVLIFNPQIINRIESEIKQFIYRIDKRESARSTKSKSVGDIYGIDISHHQGDIDWPKVKSWNNNKISFVYIKATEGSTYNDETYSKNLKEAKANGFLTGSYHYFRTVSPVKEQFRNFIKHVDKNQQDLIPLIDVEEMKNWKGSKFHKNFKEFFNLVEDHFGVKPMIYTVNSFYNRNLAYKYTKYHFLIGRYGPNSPNMKDKSNWTIWQFSETGKVEGIKKNVDIDVMNSKFQLQDILTNSKN